MIQMDMQIGSRQWQAVIRQGAEEVGVAVDDAALHGFAVHAVEMIKFNRRINLTAITDPFSVAVKHVIDSLAAAPHVPADARLLDIGSGAGFPGIPLKIVRPLSTVVLIDAVARKVSFLKHVIRQLGLDGLSARHQRAEQMGDNSADLFDVVISRALSSLQQCVQLACPLIKRTGGTIVALRGHVGDGEISALRQWLNRRAADADGMDYDLDSYPFPLPFLNDCRTVIKVRLSG